MSARPRSTARVSWTADPSVPGRRDDADAREAERVDEEPFDRNVERSGGVEQCGDGRGDEDHPERDPPDRQAAPSDGRLREGFRDEQGRHVARIEAARCVRVVGLLHRRVLGRRAGREGSGRDLRRLTACLLDGRLRRRCLGAHRRGGVGERRSFVDGIDPVRRAGVGRRGLVPGCGIAATIVAAPEQERAACRHEQQRPDDLGFEEDVCVEPPGSSQTCEQHRPERDQDGPDPPAGVPLAVPGRGGGAVHDGAGTAVAGRDEDPGGEVDDEARTTGKDEQDEGEADEDGVDAEVVADSGRDSPELPVACVACEQTACVLHAASVRPAPPAGNRGFPRAHPDSSLSPPRGHPGYRRLTGACDTSGRRGTPWSTATGRSIEAPTTV